jgi:hypothetical protein
MDVRGGRPTPHPHLAATVRWHHRHRPSRLPAKVDVERGSSFSADVHHGQPQGSRPPLHRRPPAPRPPSRRRRRARQAGLRSAEGKRSSAPTATTSLSACCSVTACASARRSASTSATSPRCAPTGWPGCGARAAATRTSLSCRAPPSARRLPRGPRRCPGLGTTAGHPQRRPPRAGDGLEGDRPPRGQAPGDPAPL